MADFLSSFNFSEQTPSQTSARSCGSLEEVQSRLREIFITKVTPTRAEHVAITLELAGTAHLTLEKDNDVPEGLNNIDPLLGGLGALTEAMEQPESGLQAVVASDALMNQPLDNPVLQRSVAKAIISGLGALDGSDWTVKGLSRGTEGWTFAYVCKSSFHHWNRQNKSQIKAVIADCSQKEPDPQLSARPAFDCRGSVTITFSPHSRTISIRYDHTPLHKTVADLAALFAPPPPPPKAPKPVVEKQKTPKKTPSAKRQRIADGSSTKKPRGGDKTPKENGSAKKRMRRVDNSTSAQLNGTGVDASVAGLLQTGEETAQQHSVATGLTTTAANSSNQTQSLANGQLALNVTPEEAARRRNVASVILRDAGVDPDTLSVEQFTIFANQSPDLQKESLSMLVKYGAERLRIVHPGNREGSVPTNQSTESTAAQANSIQTSPSGPVTTRELALQTKSVDGGGQAGNANGAADLGTGAEGVKSSKSRRRGKTKSRVACFQCKQRKTKCPHEMPTCAECQTAGLLCEYPPPKSKKTKSTAEVAPEDLEENVPDEPEEILPQQPQQQQEEVEEMDDDEPDEEEREEEQNPSIPQVDGEYAEGHDNSVQPQMPVADMLTTDMGAADWGNDDTENHYYHSAASMSVATETNTAHPSGASHGTASGLLLPNGREYYPQHVQTTEMHEQHTAETLSSGQTTASPRDFSMERRQPLPDGPGVQHQRNSQQSPLSQHAAAATAPDWHAMTNLVTQAATATVLTSALPTQTSEDHGYGMGTDSARDRQGIWRAAALSQAPVSQNLMANASQSSMAGNQQQQQIGMQGFQRHGAASPAIAEAPRTKPGQVRHASQAAASFNDSRAVGALHTSTVSDQHASSQGSMHQTQANLNATTNYNDPYDHFADNRSTSSASLSSRITYEPYSYQRSALNTSSYPSYGQSTHNQMTPAATAVEPTPDQSSQSNTRLYSQFSQSQVRTQVPNQNQSQIPAQTQKQSQAHGQGQSRNRNHNHSHAQTTSHSTGSGYDASLARTQDMSNSHSYDARGNRNVRAAAPSQSSSGSAKPERQAYNSYSSQMKQQQQRVQQQQQQEQQEQQAGQRHGQQTSRQQTSQQHHQQHQHEGWYNFSNQGGSTYGSSNSHGAGNMNWGLSGS